MSTKESIAILAGLIAWAGIFGSLLMMALHMIRSHRERMKWHQEQIEWMKRLGERDE